MLRFVLVFALVLIAATACSDAESTPAPAPTAAPAPSPQSTPARTGAPTPTPVPSPRPDSTATATATAEPTPTPVPVAPEDVVVERDAIFFAPVDTSGGLGVFDDGSGVLPATITVLPGGSPISFAWTVIPGATAYAIVLMELQPIGDGRSALLSTIEDRTTTNSWSWNDPAANVDGDHYLITVEGLDSGGVSVGDVQSTYDDAVTVGWHFRVAGQ